MYEDDGRSQAYRAGRHALTSFECVAEFDQVVIRISEPTGDRSVIPSGRRYVLQVRIDRVVGVRMEGVGELPRRQDARATRPGWWEDGHGFTCIRLPDRPAGVVTLRT
jgi:hypothetical protein